MTRNPTVVIILATGTSCRVFLVYDIVIIRLISAGEKLISLEVEGAKDLAALSD